MTFIVVHLILVILTADEKTEVRWIEFAGPTAAADCDRSARHFQVSRPGDIADLGTLCVKSEFSLMSRPRA